MKKRILFVCKHNRFRSRIAEAFFNKLNGNKNYAAESAGLIKGEYPLSGAQIDAGKYFGIDIDGKPRGLSIDLLKEADIIVIVADDIPREVLNNDLYLKKGIVKKIIYWKIPDVYVNDEDKIRKTVHLIEEKVKEFVKTLK